MQTCYLHGLSSHHQSHPRTTARRLDHLGTGGGLLGPGAAVPNDVLVPEGEVQGLRSGEMGPKPKLRSGLDAGMNAKRSQMRQFPPLPGGELQDLLWLQTT